MEGAVRKDMHNKTGGENICSDRFIVQLIRNPKRRGPGLSMSGFINQFVNKILKYLHYYHIIAPYEIPLLLRMVHFYSVHKNKWYF